MDNSYKTNDEWNKLSNCFKMTKVIVTDNKTYTHFASCSEYNKYGKWIIDNRNKLENDNYIISKNDNNVCIGYSRESPFNIFLETNG